MTGEWAEGAEAIEVTPTELLEMGKEAHRKGQLDAARQVYEALLEFEPGYGEAEHFLGMLLCQAGDAETGLPIVERSLRSPAATGGWWSNYGNLLRIDGRLNESIDAFEQAVKLDPGSCDAYNNLGLTQIAKGNAAIAAACFERALEIDPTFALAWTNLGNHLIGIGRMAEGVEALLKSFTLTKTKSPQDRRMLALAWGELGEFEKARAVYEEWLAVEPDNPLAAHHLASFGGKTPPRADDRYVATVFDSFAKTFDEKLAILGYRGPELVVAEAAAVLGHAAGDRRIADAGCGTGLCGPGLRPFAGRLVGVDLSPGMIARARERGLYDALFVAELTAWFGGSAESFDLIASADTLIYFGDLAPPLAAFHKSLAPGGTVVFTVEAHEEEGRSYELRHHGRYAHGAAHLRGLIESIGFMPPMLRREQMRTESGKPAMGWLVRASKPAAR